MTKTNQINTIEFEPFLLDDGMPLNAMLRDGDPWFKATDAGELLGLSGDGGVLTRDLDDDEKGLYTVQTLRGKQRVMYVSESGFYKLMFKSRKPEAKAICKRVTSEILPAIRKYGFYVRPDIANEFMTVWKAAKCFGYDYKTIRRRMAKYG